MSTPREEQESPAIAQWFSLVLLLSGLAFYLSWGALYGAWTDIGVYSVTAVLVGFGLIGYLLYSPEADPDAE